MSRTEWLAAYGSLVTLFVVGVAALYTFSWPLALLAAAYLGGAWFGLHRARMCAHCRHSGCPGHPAGAAPSGPAGFRGWEGPVFRTTFALVLVALLAAVWLASLWLGAAVSALTVYGFGVYYVRVCRTCDLPCPVARIAGRGSTARGAT